MDKKNAKKIRPVLKKVWWFIWESNSVWSWIVNIILAFVIIKFMVYPALGLMLGTTHPVVAVISNSMEHENEFGQWWDSKCCTDIACTSKISQGDIYGFYRIEKANFTEFPFESGFNRGDIMVLVSPEDIKAGDIIVFNADHRADPIIHRVVSIGANSYTTKGDNNCGSAAFEQSIPEERVIGKAVLRIPFLGWIKIGFINLLRIFSTGGQ